ncbi:MAG: ROK family protein [Clostridiales bacterium]|nr:ROK family protein [Candidatus Cacconaster stercorequi]
MSYLGIQTEYQPLAADQAFVPFGAWMDAYLAQATRPVRVAIERGNGCVSVFRTQLRGAEFAAANERFLERFVKFALWSAGGWRMYLCGCDAEAETICRAYAPGGARQFDAAFMERVYQRPFSVIYCDEQNFPTAHEAPVAVGGHLSGCRIGFDAGGSDRKVSAVVDGETVFAREVVWHPKLSENPQYQYDGIVSALREAAAHLPRVDAVGVSSAGVIIDHRPMVSSLFRRVPKERIAEVHSIYQRAAREVCGDVPLAVANDGDVTALAGSMSLQCGAVLGIAMGTSQAAGYVTADGCLTGWLNELAFAPVDLQLNASMDEWSGDRGVGGQYFSQEAVIRLASAVGISMPEELTPAEKLTAVQRLAEQNDPRAEKIFRTMGGYLAHALGLYRHFYQMEHILLLGRVVSGQGGLWLLEECRAILAQQYPMLSALDLRLPDEKTRRVGQAVAAASLPVIAAE